MNNKELIKAGHELAAELKGSFEAINACSVAQLISDLATQLDVQFARSNALAAKLSMINGLMDAAEQANKLAQEATEKLVQERDALAAENAGLKDFVKTCFRAAADGASLDGADIQELGERLGLFGRETYQPALHGYICGHEAGEDTVYVMKKTPATSAFLAEVRAHDINAFIQHHSAELDAHIKNGGEQFDEKSVRIRDIIVSARLFREQFRKGDAI